MADPQAPWTSGSDILSNPGNAALASGSGAGVMPLQIDTKPVYSVLDKMMDEDVRMRFQKQAQDREDRAALGQTLATLKGKGSAFNMKGADGSNVSFSPLPDDQRVLQEKADDLRRTILKNPDNYDVDPQYLKKKEEYDYLLQHASKRAILHSQNRVSAAQAADPEDRAGYLQTNQDEILSHSLTEFHEPNSYIPKPTIDPEKILSGKELADKNNYHTIKTDVKDGVQTDMIGLRDDMADIRSRITPGTPAYVEAVKMSQSFIKTMDNDPQAVIAMNDRLAKYNAERGYQPGDPHYQPPVAQVTPEGKVLFPAKPDPAQIVGAIYFDRHGGLTPSQKPTKIEEEKRNLESEIKRRQDQTSIEYAKLKAEREKLKAEAEKTKKPSAEELKENQNEKSGLAAYREVKNVYAPDHYTSKNKLSQVKSLEVGAAAGLPVSDYEFYKVPADLAPGKFIGVPAEEITTTEGAASEGHKVTTKTAKGKSAEADEIYMAINPKTGEGQLVYMKGLKPIAVVPERQAIANGIKHESQYDEKVYTNPIIYGQYAFDQNAPVATQTEQPTPTGEKKTVKGVTYEKYTDGHWYQ
jgi:hypothetical protein